MRLVICISFLFFGLSFSVVSAGQDSPTVAVTSEKAPTEKSAKSEDSSEAQTEAVNEPFDLDSFFEQGEENAEKGSNCEKAPEPIA